MIRHSKFRHVFGCPFKKEVCYEQLRVTKSAHDNNFCAVNPLFLAVVVESSGGGAFIVLPLNKTGRSDINIARVCGHKAPVTDIKFNLHDDYVLATASDDCTIKIWQIPSDGITEDVDKPLYDLRRGHQKRVSYIDWHPTVSNVLLSAGVDQKCIVWDIITESIIYDIAVHPDNIFSISWNFNGSLFATTCKDKKLRVIDPRAGLVVAETVCQQGSKPSKVVFLKNGWLLTTGFMRSSERQISLWDWHDLSKPLKVESIDNACGILFPFYDSDLNIIYLAGKGDGNIRYMEIIEEEPYIYFLNQFQSSIPQSGLAMMNKRGLDVKRCEIARFFKLHSSKDICEPISMIVPRKSEWFQADIYPPTMSPTPSSTLSEWLNGINKDPFLVSAEDTIGTISERIYFVDEMNEEKYDKNTNDDENNLHSIQKNKMITSDYNNNSLKSGLEKETIMTGDANKQNNISNHKRNSPDDVKKKLTRSHASRSNTFSASTLSNDVNNYHHPAISRNSNKIDGKYRPIRRRRPSYNDDDDDDDDFDLDNNEIVDISTKKDNVDVSLNSIVLENKKYGDSSNKIRSDEEIKSESNQVISTKDSVDNESSIDEDKVSFSDCVKYFEKDTNSKHEAPLVSPEHGSKDSIQKMTSNFEGKTEESSLVPIKCPVEKKESIVEKLVDNFDNGIKGCQEENDEPKNENSLEQKIQSAVVHNVLLVQKETTSAKDENNSLSNGDLHFSNTDSNDFEQNKGSSKLMLDCISVDAPDDALILPSSLRASMNSKTRRVIMKNEKQQNNQNVDLDSDLKGLIRVGSVRERSRSFNKLRSSNSYNRPQSVVVSNRQCQKSSSSDENKTNETDSLNQNSEHSNIERPTLNTRPKRSLSATRSHDPSSHDSYSSTAYYRLNQPKAFSKDINNVTVSNGLPGKSLKDLKKETNSVSGKIGAIDYNNNNKKIAESTEASIDSTKEIINLKHSKDERNVIKRVNKTNRDILNNEINNCSNNNHSSIKNIKIKKSDLSSKQNSSSLSHSELLHEHQRQQCEIKQLKKLLDQKDLKIKKLEMLLQQKAR